jgi:hypothetical protein
MPRAKALMPEQVPADSKSILDASSSFRRAGASALLLGDQEAMASAFDEANLTYSQLNSSEAYLMKALSGKKFEKFWQYPEIPDSPELEFEGLDEYRAKLIYELLRAAEAEPSPPKKGFTWRWRSARALEFSGSSIGILGLEDFTYLDLCSSVAHFSETGVPPKPLAISLAPFLSAYDRAIQSAFQNRSNWQLLLQRIHPAEPDIIGLLCMVQLALRSSELRDALTELPMSGLCRALLLGCMETRFPDDFGNNPRTSDVLRM